MPKVHEVQPGDCLSSIAFEHGFFVQTLWDDSNNAALKKTRGDPSVLRAGDAVHIPDKRVKNVAVQTGAAYRFRRLGVPAQFKLRLVEADEPRASLDYSLEVDGKTLTGTTDADGVITQYISPAARSATLIVHAAGGDERYAIRLGEVDPLETPRGVQSRLANLGFYEGDPGGDPAATEAAIRAFQARYGLTVSGAADEGTRAKLKEAFGS